MRKFTVSVSQSFESSVEVMAESVEEAMDAALEAYSPDPSEMVADGEERITSVLLEGKPVRF